LQKYFGYDTGDGDPIEMGCPISSIIAEIFLQSHENTHLNQLLEAKSIVFDTRYADDIFIISDTDITTPEKTQNCKNKLHPNLEFTPTLQDNNRINFHDLVITRKPSTIETDIYRKSTTTDTTSNFTSNHPTEHKLVNRVISLHLSLEKEETEW
jgi:hypothetical protein